MTPFPPTTVPFKANLWIAARLMPVFAKRARLDALLDFATPPPDAQAFQDMSTTEIARAVKASVARPWRMRGRRCLREGLLAFRYLSLAGHAPVLHFGIIPSSLKTDRPSAHCWVSVAGETILNPPAEPMTQLFTYDGSMPVAGSIGLPEIRDGH